MGQLSAEDRAQITAYLERTREALLETTSDMPPARWTWRAAEESWTAAECAEHIVIVESILLTRALKTADREVEPERAAKTAGKELKLVERLPARLFKAKAPDGMHPTGRYSGPGEFHSEFAAVRTRVIDMVRESNAPLHHVVDPHFALGDLTGAQWLWFIAAHSERHLNQIREVMASPGFPA